MLPRRTGQITTSGLRTAQTASDPRNFYGHGVDSNNTMVSNVYDSKAVQNTIGSRGRVVMDHSNENKDLVYSNDRNYGKTGWNGEFTYESPQQPQNATIPSPQAPTRTPSSSQQGIPQNTKNESEGTVWVDENHKDISKMRQGENSSDSHNFYDHGMDSRRAMVKNVYDSTAVQNTIGTAGRVLKDHGIDSTDVVYSNDRLYGKTGWNGKFVYEQPQNKSK